MPAPLRIRLNGREHRLEPDRVHYLSTKEGALHLGDEQIGPWFGSVASQLDYWWLHLEPQRLPANVWLNGKRLSRNSIELPSDRVHDLWVGERRPAIAHELVANLSGRSTTVPAPQPQRSRAAAGRRRVWSIGRAGTRADISVDDPLVRAEHAWMELDNQGRWWVTQGAGRVYVDGIRVMSAVLDEGSVFVVGQTAVAASRDLLAGGWSPVNPPPTQVRSNVAVSAGTGLSVEARDVVVCTQSGKTLLDKVNLSVRPGEMVAIVGPSGAGKSTLMKVLLGDLAPDSGTVSISNGQTRYRSARPVDRCQIRYVPQSDEDLYRTLTVAETLTYAARFRATTDVSDSYIATRVRGALEALGLQRQESNRIDQLSGGQRKRVSIGLELVGLPQLLILDEPTSGLDLAKDRQIMHQLREVSQRYHCTVIVVTHAVTHLDKVDQLIVMQRGGRIQYAGPPVDPAVKGFASWADWLEHLDEERAKPATTRSARSAPAAPNRRRPPERPLAGWGWALARQVKVVARRGPKSLVLLALMPLVGAFVAILAADTGLRPEGAVAQVLAILVTVAALTGAALSYLDLVNDRAIIQRDWRVGVTSLSLLLAKTLVFGGICAVLSGAMTLVYAMFRDLPPPALGLPPYPMLFGTLFLIMLSSMGLGILISAIAPSVERAVTYNTLLAVLQVALNGALFQVPVWLTPLTLALPGRLGLAAVACYADLNSFRAPPAYDDGLWTQNPVRFWLLLFAMAAVATFTSTAAGWLTERRYARG